MRFYLPTGKKKKFYDCRSEVSFVVFWGLIFTAIKIRPIDKHFEHVYYNSNDPNNKIGNGTYSEASFQVWAYRTKYMGCKMNVRYLWWFYGKKGFFLLLRNVLQVADDIVSAKKSDLQWLLLCPRLIVDNFALVQLVETKLSPQIRYLEQWLVKSRNPRRHTRRAKNRYALYSQYALCELWVLNEIKKSTTLDNPRKDKLS